MSGLVRGTAVTAAARGGALVLGIASSIILARALGPAGRGMYALIVLIPALLALTGGLGLDPATTYFVARRRDRARSLATTLALTSAALGVALIAVYALITALPPYRHFLRTTGAEPALVWILVALLPATLAAQTLTAAVLALGRYRTYNVITLVTPAVTLLLLLVLVGGPGLDIAGAVVAAGLGTAAGLIAAVMAFHQVAPAAEPGSDGGVLRAAFGFGWRAHLGNLAWFIHYRADMFLVGYLAGPAALGFYSTAVGLAEKLYLAPSAVGTVLFPRVASGDAEREAAGGREPDGRDAGPRPGTGGSAAESARACRHTLWLTVALAAALAIVAPPLIELLYGAAFRPSVAPLWALLPGVASLAVGRVVSADLSGRGRPGVVARANGALAAVNVALNLWWIPLWGATGAALATSCSYTAAAFVLARRYRRLAGVGWRDLLLLRRSDRSALAALLGLGGGG